MHRNRTAATNGVLVIISGWLTYIRSHVATINVLMIICLMYFIMYVDRKIRTVAQSIRIYLKLTATELGIVFRPSLISMRFSKLSGGSETTSKIRQRDHTAVDGAYDHCPGLARKTEIKPLPTILANSA
jgi:hypothetical protein